MDLLQNPFYILTATQQDNLHRIMELAAEQRLLLDTDECVAAQATLTNPRKRISAGNGMVARGRPRTRIGYTNAIRGGSGESPSQ